MKQDRTLNVCSGGEHNFFPYHNLILIKCFSVAKRRVKNLVIILNGDSHNGIASPEAPIEHIWTYTKIGRIFEYLVLMERCNFNDWLIWMITRKRNCVHDEVSDMLLTYWFHYISIVFVFPNTWAQGRIRLELKVINVSIKYAKYQWVDRIKIKVIHCKINLIKSFYESILIFFDLFFPLWNPTIILVDFGHS